jgi:hypothetical protein
VAPLSSRIGRTMLQCTVTRCSMGVHMPPGARHSCTSACSQEKMQRTELLAEQKERLVQEMAALRRHMGQQEAAMKQLLDRAARGDARLLQSVDLGQLGLVRPDGLCH